MAQVTNAFDTYEATSDREALSNIIYNIAPHATPFMSAIGKNSVKNVTFDWQTETLPSASGTGEIEGFEISRAATTATVRESNVTMIQSRNSTVTGSQQASDPAGVKSQIAHFMALNAKALKRDMETALTGNYAKVAGSASAARQTRSFESWITSNDSRGSGGADGSASAAATDGTQRDLTEALLKGVLQTGFGNGAEMSMAICGPYNKTVISGFTGRSNVRQVIETDTVEASISLYASDFGELKIVPDNFSRERSLLLVDPNYAAVSYLRDFESVDISTIGDAITKMLVVEYGLQMSNEAAHGIVADLNTS
tara:strand:+ start:1761 stop:2696 length:936 start_codon:yes stop_codon:yes gene_type:complete